MLTWIAEAEELVNTGGYYRCTCIHFFTVTIDGSIMAFAEIETNFRKFSSLEMMYCSYYHLF